MNLLVPCRKEVASVGQGSRTGAALTTGLLGGAEEGNGGGISTIQHNIV